MYVNEEYGFSFRYPKEWILEGKIFSSNQDSESLSLMINVPFGLECLRSIKEESIIFDKVNATKTLMDGVVSDLCDNANSRLVAVGFNLNENLINLLFGFDIDDEEQALINLDQILSTFKFIDNVD